MLTLKIGNRDLGISSQSIPCKKFERRDLNSDFENLEAEQRPEARKAEESGRRRSDTTTRISTKQKQQKLQQQIPEKKKSHSGNVLQTNVTGGISSSEEFRKIQTTPDTYLEKYFQNPQTFTLNISEFCDDL